jgi:uracil-DNA glycosylase
MPIKIESSWKSVLEKEFEQPYFIKMVDFLRSEKAGSKIIYPPGSEIFNAYNTTPFDKVKVVLLGQDPYHGAGQAHGLCFSVPEGVRPPPSLINIYKELQADVGVTMPAHGNLSAWGRQGVFLLNASLTVRAAEPMSHAKIGWAQFTDASIKVISDLKTNIVFLLWGKFAQEKYWLIDDTKHLILKAAHPSPFSAHNGFLGCKHFSATNEYLVQHNIAPIQWAL